MNFFPKKPYEAFVAPFFVVTKWQIFTQKTNVYEVSIPKTRLFIYLLMGKITKFLYLVVYMLKGITCKCFDGCFHSPTMIFLGKLALGNTKENRFLNM
jgi:hypothetical protein